MKPNGASSSYPSSETQAETSAGTVPASSSSPNPLPHMTLKRSSSPDGRIDSLSIEIDVPITKSSTAELQEQALRLIALQDGIWQSYRRKLQEKESQNRGKNPPAHGADHSAPADNGNPEANLDRPQKARLVEVGQADTQYGKRIVVSFELAGGRTTKLFGSDKAIAKQLAAVGLKLESIKLGKRLNVPCLVTTRINGKFLNIERVFPSAAQ